MKTVLAALLSLLTLVGTVHAETFQYDARTDFDSLDEGDAPYYIDNPRAAVAIFAANEEYREVFARASTTFTETAGKYDVTISALGEIDGECEYRFLVNGVVVGTAVNQPVSTDYELQQHTFPGISIPPGAVISVESNALTNGLIPEGDSTAYARGRWQTLTLETSPVTDTIIDLSIAASVSTESPAVGEQYTVVMAVTNNSTDEVATNPVITLPALANTTFTHNGSCATDADGTSCPVAELIAGESTTLELIATTIAEGVIDVTASVSADQSDSDMSNNTASVEVRVVTPTPDSVDLALSVSSNADVVDAGQTIEYLVTVQNQHQETTATAPVTGAALPAGLMFESSADCTSTGQTINCLLPELAPNQSASVTFTATAVQPGSAALIASVSANEPETTVLNNEVTHTITVIDNHTSNNNSGDGGSSGNPTTGAGRFNPGTLILLLLYLASRPGKIAPQQCRQQRCSQRTANGNRDNSTQQC